MRCKTETLAVVHNFTFFTGTSNGSKTFLHCISIQIVYFSYFSEFLEYQRYGECSDYYKLSCLRHILFLMHYFNLLVLMILSIFIGGISHGKVILR